jgi:short subunit dehydrogenase-like uncharacterized protein
MVVLIGATGFTGRLVARAIRRRGLALAVAGRDPQKLAELASEVGAEVRVCDIARPESIDAAIAGAKVCVSCAGPFLKLGEPVVAACAARGVHYLDTTGEQPFVRLVFEKFVDAKAALVPAFAFEVAIGDAAAALAARGKDRVDTVEVTYTVPHFAPSRGTQQSIVGMAGQTGVLWEDGGFRELRIAGESKKVDGRTALLFPSPEVITIPRHVRARVVKTFVVSSRGQAIAMRIGAPFVSRVGPRLRGFLERRVASRSEGPSDETRAAQAWSVHATADDRAVVVRGRDVYGITAEIAALGAERLAVSTLRGPQAPSQAVPADEIFRDLAKFGVTVDT